MGATGAGGGGGGSYQAEVPSPVGTGRGVSRTTGTLNVCEVCMALAGLAAEPEAAALHVDGVRVGDVEEGVHVIAWPFEVVAAAMGVLSHRASALVGVQRSASAAAVSRPPRVRPAPPGWYDRGMTYTSPLAEELAEDVLDRFLRYVRVDTQSARDGDGTPSTPGQLDLSRMLVDELREMGIEDAELDGHGYVYATIPGAGAARRSSGCSPTSTRARTRPAPASSRWCTATTRAA